MASPHLLYLKNGAVWSPCGPVAEVPKLPELLATFLRHAPDTRPLESLARTLVASRFPDEASTIEFIRRVFKWGGRTGARIRGRIEAHYRGSFEPVRSCFSQAAEILADPRSDVRDALACVNRIKYLGGVSYASKHLRFMAPERCVTLDTNLAGQLGVKLDPINYAALCRECAAIARELNGSLRLPPVGSAAWSAADVEVAVFTRLNPEVVMGTASCRGGAGFNPAVSTATIAWRS